MDESNGSREKTRNDFIERSISFALNVIECHRWRVNCSKWSRFFFESFDDKIKDACKFFCFFSKFQTPSNIQEFVGRNFSQHHHHHHHFIYKWDCLDEMEPFLNNSHRSMWRRFNGNDRTNIRPISNPSLDGLPSPPKKDTL